MVAQILASAPQKKLNPAALVLSHLPSGKLMSLEKDTKKTKIHNSLPDEDELVKLRRGNDLLQRGTDELQRGNDEMQRGNDLAHYELCLKAGKEAIRKLEQALRQAECTVIADQVMSEI